MIVSTLQSLTALTLAGGFFYLIFATPGVRRRVYRRQALFGLVAGVLVIFLGFSAFSIEALAISISAKPGPLVFAGYLGGPVGGLIAACLSALYLLSLDVPMPSLLAGLFAHVGFVAVGLGVRKLVAPRDWPRVPMRAVWLLLAGFVVLQALPVLALGLFGSNGPSLETILFNVAFVCGLGILSILVTWQVVALAHRFAIQADEKARLTSRLELVLKSAGVGVTSRIAGSDDIFVDAGALEIYGLTDRAPGLMSVNDLWATFHPDDLDRVRTDLENQTAAETQHLLLEFRIIRPSDGETRHILLNWGCARDPQSGKLELTSVLSDVTDLRQMAASRAEALGRLEAAADNVPGMIYQGIWSSNGAEKHLYLGGKSREYWGVEPQQAYDDAAILTTGKTPEELAMGGRVFMDAAHRGTAIHRRSQVRGRWIDFHGSAAPIGDDLCRVDGVVVDATGEVAALDEAQRQTELANRAQRMESIGQLTGGIAHDFNNLLAVIMGNLELLKDDIHGPDQRRMIEAGLEATRRGADLTRSMLAFARRARLDPEPLDLNEVIRHARNWMYRALPETVDMETSLLAGLWQVRLDAASLESAILNLLLNARDAMAGHGKLTIETANLRIDDAYVDSRDQELLPGRYVMLAISDTGTGIPEHSLHKIFEPFYTTKGPGQGSGIGLSMVQGFVKQSGGTVQVYTEPGQGTTFKLYFPATNADGSMVSLNSRRAASARFDAGGLRLLLAEDETAVRKVLVATLRAAGFDVTAAASGDEAMAVYAANPVFDVVITDIVMPGTLQGTGLARALRALNPDLPMIFMSGYASEATVHGNGLRPEDIRLMKPVPKGDLLRAVAQVLGRTAPAP
ncbi:PAS domain S-box-containing protein [Salipiger aestuarii]|uniref:histidine kinase n=1 Tax=Salipiger aestuarii TaxID=568098 RepID=A0A327XYK9_9RHOB|nr:ATP-binding protein [Salipiger aestuarii]RAK14068.1 PAS domain S-box-containing protein [Salipiger aestuarii]